MTTSEKIREARQAAGLSQEAAARKLDVSASTWAHWEQGVNEPRLEAFRRIAKLLGVNPGDLL